MAKGDRIYIVDRKEMQEGLNRLQEKLESNDSKTDKRLTNLEQGLPADRWVNDTGVAYTKDVPVDALPYAGVDMVGGMTRKTANLIPYPYDFGESYTYHGVTFVANTDGSISLNGVSTNTQLVNLYLNKNNMTILPAGTYTISGIPLNGNPVSFVGSLYDMDDVLIDYIFGNTFTITETRKFDILLQMAVGASFSGETVYPMMNAGDTALPYEPYFDGLRSAPVTEVESVGVNLFGGDALADKLVELGGAKNAVNKTAEIAANVIDNKVIFDKFKPNTRYTFLVDGYNTSGSNDANIRIEYTDGSSVGLSFYQGKVLFVSDYTKSVAALIGLWHTHSTVFNYEKCGIFEGVLTEADFVSYHSNTLPIPAEVQALDGYGWGINADYYNYIDWERKQFVKRVGCVDLGTQNYTFYDGANYAVLVRITKEYGTSIYSPSEHITAGVSNRYGDIIFYFKDGAFTDADTFKAAVSGVMLYYELAEPIITDISDLLPDDNLIGVEGGGTVTMVNEYGDDVPSEITYQLKGAEE